MPKILHLTLKKKWFDLIASGQKTTEFREAKPYWDSRLLSPGDGYNTSFIKYDEVHFTNGYGKDRPFMRVEVLGIIFLPGGNNSYSKHGDFFNCEQYAIRLGKVLELRNCEA